MDSIASLWEYCKTTFLATWTNVSVPYSFCYFKLCIVRFIRVARGMSHHLLALFLLFVVSPEYVFFHFLLSAVTVSIFTSFWHISCFNQSIDLRCLWIFIINVWFLRLYRVFHFWKLSSVTFWLTSHSESIVGRVLLRLEPILRAFLAMIPVLNKEQKLVQKKSISGRLQMTKTIRFPIFLES